MDLRFIKENGKMILQQLIDCDNSMHYKWVDIPLIETDTVLGCLQPGTNFKYNEKGNLEAIDKNDSVQWPPSLPKEFWLIAGRYFESEHDAKLWFNTHYWPDPKDKIIHVREVLAK